MSPVPIVARQRALAPIGEIRLGAEKEEGKPPRRLDTFRLTSQQKPLILRAAKHYGGEVEPWASPSGDAWQVVTDQPRLPVLVVVGYSLTLLYELWEGAARCTRRCDGITEFISQQPCICNSSGEDKCKIVTRFMVVLPELGTSLGWQLRSNGERAADELSGGMEIANQLAAGRAFVPAILRVTNRRSVGAGEVHRYVVPVLDFDPRLALNQPVDELMPATDGDNLGYTPAPALPGTGVTVAEGLATVETQTRTEHARSSAPMPSPEDDAEEDMGYVPVPDDAFDPDDPGSASSSEAVTEPASAPSNGDEAPETPEPGEEASEPHRPVQYISEAQRRRLHAVRRNAVVLEDRLKEILLEVTGQPHTSKIPAELYDKVIATIEAEETGQDALL